MKHRKSRASRTVYESLESRRHLTVAMIVGSNQAEEFHLIVNFSTILVSVDGNFSSYPRAVYNAVSIQASGGADHIYIDSNDSVPVTVNAGSGDDEIQFAQASSNLDDVPTGVTLVASIGSDRVILHDDASTFADTYTANNSRVSRGGFGGVTYNGVTSIKLSTGDGADTFDVINTNGANLILDGQAGADKLNLNTAGTGLAEVSIDSDQDFATVTSAPGGNLTLSGAASLLLTTNGSNFEGNVTLGTGSIIERNSQAVGGLGYWRSRLINGTNATTPSLRSSFANSSAANDAIGYAYAQDLPFTTLGTTTLNSGDLVLRYTLKGDANLDQTVNFSDLVSLAQNYNGTLKDWRQGDFDLSRNVNFTDLVSLAQNYNTSVAPLTLVAVRKAAVARRPAAVIV